MKNAIILLAAAMACTFPAPVFARPVIGACPNDRGMVSVDDVQAAFARRSVEIVRLAGKADEAALEKLVSPLAEFTLWEGDTVWGPVTAPRSREAARGVYAAIEFSVYLAANSYEFAVSSTGPIGTDPCGKQSATVIFSNASGDRAFVVRFDYLGGRLVSAEGHLASLTRGTVERDR